MDGNTLWVVGSLIAYGIAVIWDYKLNMKQEEIVKSYFGEENK